MSRPKTALPIRRPLGTPAETDLVDLLDGIGTGYVRLIRNAGRARHLRDRQARARGRGPARGALQPTGRRTGKAPPTT